MCAISTRSGLDLVDMSTAVEMVTYIKQGSCSHCPTIIDSVNELILLIYCSQLIITAIDGIE